MTKQVISISLGSKTRDFKREFMLGNEKIIAERIGTDGDMEKYNELMLEYDGKVDAFGIGGTDLYLRKGEDRFKIRDVWKKLIKGVKETPMVDGGGIKSTVEGRIMQFVEEKLSEEVEENRTTLVMSAVDRWGMAESAWEFVQHNKKLITFGDMIWGLQLGIPLHRMSTLKIVASILLPVVRNLPFSLLYPTGEKQEIHKPTKVKYFKEAKFIAGDFLFIKRNMPYEDMEGKVVVTNTTTEKDV
jgi:hypothetical protein